MLRKNNVRRFAAMKKQGEKISMLTGYDYMWGSLLDEAGVDIILVGDSLGNVVLGYDTTCPVTMDDMVRHTAAVSRGAARSFVLGDMPFLTANLGTVEAVRNAGRFLSEGGANGVKLEGGEPMAGVIRAIVDAGIPVCAHIGLRPQSVNLQGYVTQGVSEESREQLKKDALAVERAGAFAVVLEKVEPALAGEITDMLSIPTIGIGSGPRCDGQVLVVHDMLGVYDKAPSFVKKYANIRDIILDAVSAYDREVKQGVFPEAKDADNK
ncbi:MAG: 3-methyl-2-oxobutanoate hydroxymethyltransferase [Abditibacteriota bacterium]|nr:3-methyl-2-oxobutanoate hydroxymethyltransferase [Abditibacteriota bacterium]